MACLGSWAGLMGEGAEVVARTHTCKHTHEAGQGQGDTDTYEHEHQLGAHGESADNYGKSISSAPTSCYYSTESRQLSSNSQA